MITTRFSDAPWFRKLKGCDLQVVGCGGIGSWLTLFLSRLQPRTLYVMDDDRVEVHNLGGQFLSTKFFGKYKVDALNSFSTEFSEYGIFIASFRFEEGMETLPFTFSAVDDIETRKHLYEAWLKQDNRELFVDGRLSAEHFIVYAVTKENEERYREVLFPKSEAEPLPCNFKQTTHIAAMIASVMTTMFVNYLSGNQVPFMYEFSAPLFYQEKEN